MLETFRLFKLFVCNGVMFMHVCSIYRYICTHIHIQTHFYICSFLNYTLPIRYTMCTYIRTYVSRCFALGEGVTCVPEIWFEICSGGGTCIT